MLFRYNPQTQKYDKVEQAEKYIEVPESINVSNRTKENEVKDEERIGRRNRRKRLRRPFQKILRFSLGQNFWLNYNIVSNEMFLYKPKLLFCPIAKLSQEYLKRPDLFKYCPHIHELVE